MKTKVRLFLSFSVFCAVMGLQVRGQYYDFVMGSATTPCTTSHSIIRTIDPLRAVAYYKGGGNHNLAVIDMSGYIYESICTDDIEINDIRIVGDDIFFCGWKHSSRKGILGHASISDITNLIPNFGYQEFDWGISGSTILPWRLAAYIDGTGSLRVVTVGEMYYSSVMPNLPTWFD